MIAAALAVPAALYFRRVVPEPIQTRFEIGTPPTSDPVSFALSRRRPAAGVRRDIRGRAATVGAAARPGDGAAARGHRGSQLSVLGAGWPRHRVFCRRQAEADRSGRRRPAGAGGCAGGRGGTWNRDGVIVFAPDVAGATDARDGHGRDAGGRHAASARPGGHRWPQFLPDGRHFVFFVATGGRKRRASTSGRSTAASRRACSRQRRRPCMRRPARCCGCTRGARRAALRPSAPAGQRRADPRGPGRRNGRLAAGAFAVSATGVLAHRAGRGERRQLTWVDRAGIVRGTVGPPDEKG